jgi:hypothetical protein
MKCEGTSLSVVWSREDGFGAPPPGAVVNDTIAVAQRVIPLPDMPARGPETLVDPSYITARALAQNWTAKLTKAPDDPLPPPPEGRKNSWNPPLPLWVKRSFTLSVPQLPSQLAVYFGDLPGAVITSLSFAPGSGLLSGSWKVEGVIYENRI